MLIQQDHVDPVAQRPVHERCGHSDPPDAYHLADALEVQPEQRLALVLDDDPVTAAADQAAWPVHVDDGFHADVTEPGRRGWSVTSPCPRNGTPVSKDTTWLLTGSRSAAVRRVPWRRRTGPVRRRRGQRPGSRCRRNTGWPGSRARAWHGRSSPGTGCTAAATADCPDAGRAASGRAMRSPMTGRSMSLRTRSTTATSATTSRSRRTTSQRGMCSKQSSMSHRATHAAPASRASARHASASRTPSPCRYAKLHGSSSGSISASSSTSSARSTIRSASEAPRAADSAARLGDLHPHHRVRLERAVSQRRAQAG